MWIGDDRIEPKVENTLIVGGVGEMCVEVVAKLERLRTLCRRFLVPIATSNEVVCSMFPMSSTLFGLNFRNGTSVGYEPDDLEFCH